MSLQSIAGELRSTNPDDDRVSNRLEDIVLALRETLKINKEMNDVSLKQVVAIGKLELEKLSDTSDDIITELQKLTRVQLEILALQKSSSLDNLEDTMEDKRRDKNESKEKSKGHHIAQAAKHVATGNPGGAIESAMSLLGGAVPLALGATAIGGKSLGKGIGKGVGIGKGLLKGGLSALIISAVTEELGSVLKANGANSAFTDSIEAGGNAAAFGRVVAGPMGAIFGGLIGMTGSLAGAAASFITGKIKEYERDAIIIAEDKFNEGLKENNPEKVEAAVNQFSDVGRQVTGKGSNYLTPSEKLEALKVAKEMKDSTLTPQHQKPGLQHIQDELEGVGKTLKTVDDAKEHIKNVLYPQVRKNNQTAGFKQILSMVGQMKPQGVQGSIWTNALVEILTEGEDKMPSVTIGSKTGKDTFGPFMNIHPGMTPGTFVKSKAAAAVSASMGFDIFGGSDGAHSKLGIDVPEPARHILRGVLDKSKEKDSGTTIINNNNQSNVTNNSSGGGGGNSGGGVVVSDTNPSFGISPHFSR